METEKYAQKVLELIEQHHPGSRIFFDKKFVTDAPAGLYELCFAVDPVEIMKLPDGVFFWVKHPTEPFMSKLDPAHIFGPFRLVTEYDESAISR